MISRLSLPFALLLTQIAAQSDAPSAGAPVGPSASISLSGPGGPAQGAFSECNSACNVEAADAADCALDDPQCFCTSQDFEQGILDCYQQCTLQENAQALEYGRDLCVAAGVPINTNVSLPPLTSAVSSAMSEMSSMSSGSSTMTSRAPTSSRSKNNSQGTSGDVDEAASTSEPDIEDSESSGTMHQSKSTEGTVLFMAMGVLIFMTP